MMSLRVASLKQCGMISGEDIVIHDNVIINPLLTKMGSYIAISDFCVFTTQLELGNYIHIAQFCSVIGGKDAKLIMGDFSGLSAGARIICATDDFINTICMPVIPKEFNNVKNKPVILEGFNLVGTNGIVMPGVKMAEGSCLAAGSILTKDTEAWTIYLGSPAKPYKERNKEKILKDADKIRELAFRTNS